LENTRIGISGFEAFKQQKKEVAGGKPNGEDPVSASHIPAPNSQETPATTENVPQTLEEPEVQSELGLDEPPLIESAIPEPKDWAHSIPEPLLMQWWEEFIETQSVRTASFMKTIRPLIEDKDVVVKVPASKVEVLEAVKFPFNRFISDRSQGKLNNFRVEPGEVVEQERRPYTDKEKLEYMIKKNPGLEEIIKKLGLRLP
jgi:hypothetical protein